MKIGYARVSTADQHLTMQEDALRKDGCKEVFTDVVSGAKSQRPGLDEALAYLRDGDTLVVWKLDRLGRSIQHLIDTIKLLNERKVGFKSLQENIDTSTSGGKLIFHIFSALAEFERELIRERTGAGLKAARARGRLGGRPPMLDNRQINRMVEMYDEQKNTVAEICKIYSISRPSFYNYLKKKKLKKMLASQRNREKLDNFSYRSFRALFRSTLHFFKSLPKSFLLSKATLYCCTPPIYLLH